MIEKNVILILILLVTFLRAVIKRFRGNFNISYLIISLFVVAAPFNFEWTLKKFIVAKSFETYDLDYLSDARVLQGYGTFGSAIGINVSILIILILMLFGHFKLNMKSFNFKLNKWLYLLLIFCVISYFNPYNIVNASVFPVLTYVLQFFLLFQFISSNFSTDTILKGVFDGLVVLTVSNFIITICYPILDMQWASTFIYGKLSLLNDTRREGYPATSGVFVHPVPLGAFTLIPTAFFISCYLKKYGNRIVLGLLIFANLFVCLFTFSRTSYLAIIVAVAALLLFYGSKNKIAFTKKTITFSVVCVTGVLLIYTYLTVFSNLLLFKNAGTMWDFREVHWSLAYEIWQTSPFIGVGLNSHIYFMQHIQVAKNSSFGMAATNYAIHSEHLTVLAETGIIGILAWAYFLIIKLKDTSTLSKEQSNPSLDIFKMTFFCIIIGIIVVYGAFNPFPYSILSLVFFFGYFSTDRNSIKGSSLKASIYK